MPRRFNQRIFSIRFLLLLASIIVLCQLAWYDRSSSSSKGCSYETPSLSSYYTTEKIMNVTNKPLVVNSPTKPILNRVDFKFVFPEVTPNIPVVENLFLVVFVNSGAKGHRDRRDAIRQTWGNHGTCEQRKAMEKQKNRTWLLVFVVGKTGKSEEDLANVKEAKEHNDMLIGDIFDNYVNNIIKLYMGLLWSSTWAPRYILKTDDDVYVRIPSLVEYLVDQGLPKRYYGGKTFTNYSVLRHGKWGISRQYYSGVRWPPFNSGAFVAFSSDLVGSLFDYIKHRQPFHTDDAYVGVAARDLQIVVRNIESFSFEHNMARVVRTMSDCELLKVIGFSHNVHSKSSQYLHGRLENMCRKNVTGNSCEKLKV